MSAGTGNWHAFNAAIDGMPDGCSRLPSVLCTLQGVPGAYSEMAALKACPGWEPLPCEQFETAFQALSQVGRQQGWQWH